MSKRTLAGLIVLLIILGGVIWLTTKTTQKAEIITPVLSVRASTLSAHPQDTVVFTLSAENQTDTVIPGFVIEVDISQVTDKSVLLDAQGASYNSANNSLVWTPLDIPAHGLIQKQFTVRVNPLATGSMNPVMRITFNNELNIALSRLQVAGAETTPKTSFKAPVTGPGLNITFILAFLATGGLFLARRNIQTIKNRSQVEN